MALMDLIWGRQPRMGTMDALEALDGGGDGGDLGDDDGDNSRDSGGGGGEPSGERQRQATPSSGSDAGDGDGDGDGDGAKAPPKPKERKVKVKRRGKEEEIDLSAPDLDRLETLLKELDDEHEEEYSGPGGKPVALNRAGIQRAVEQSHGFLEKMERLANDRKAWEEQISWARDPKNLEDFLEGELGIEDIEDWAMKIAERVWWRDRVVGVPYVEGPDGNPMQNPQYNAAEHAKLLRERAEQKATRKARIEKAQAQARAKAETARQRDERGRKIMQDAIRKAGVEPDDTLMSIAGRILDRYARAQSKISADTLASEAIKAYDEFLLRRFDGLSTERKLKLLGDKRRGILRDAELEASKLAKKEQRQQKREDDPEGGGGGGRGRKEQTTDDFLRSLRS